MFTKYINKILLILIIYGAYDTHYNFLTKLYNILNKIN